MPTPARCKRCVHCRKTNGTGDVVIQHDYDMDEVEYCDYIERYDDWGRPLPYPYFYKEEYPCKGYKINEDMRIAEYKAENERHKKAIRDIMRKYDPSYDKEVDWR